jgi:hypothetical protein
VEYREEKKQELKEVLDLVKEKFPEIKLEFGYDCFDKKELGIICTQIITTTINFEDLDYSSINGSSYLKSISILATDNYFQLSLDEKLSSIAHEFGHIVHCAKSTNPKRLYRHNKWTKEMLGVYNVSKHKVGRLEKWRLLKEVYADTQAAKKGYSEGILSFLKRQKPSDEKYVIEQKVRIKNIENILGKA